MYRSWMNNQGKPIIGICNTWSELTPCNGCDFDFLVGCRGAGVPWHSH